MAAKMIMLVVLDALHAASWPLRWKQLDRPIALHKYGTLMIYVVRNNQKLKLK
jgi:hypothetical protein